MCAPACGLGSRHATATPSPHKLFGTGRPADSNSSVALSGCPEAGLLSEPSTGSHAYPPPNPLDVVERRRPRLVPPRIGFPTKERLSVRIAVRLLVPPVEWSLRPGVPASEARLSQHVAHRIMPHRNAQRPALGAHVPSPRSEYRTDSTRCQGWSGRRDVRPRPEVGGLP